MKRFLPILIAALVAVLCVKPSAPSDEALASFLQTKADAPLEGTVWQHDTGEEYDRYLLFRDGQISLFYGLVEQDGLQRWSDFYTAPYALENGVIKASLEYPLWGQKEKTEKASVVRSSGAFTIDLDGDGYTYYGPYEEGLEELWMKFTVTIRPWE